VAGGPVCGALAGTLALDARKRSLRPSFAKYVTSRTRAGVTPVSVEGAGEPFLEWTAAFNGDGE